MSNSPPSASSRDRRLFWMRSSHTARETGGITMNDEARDLNVEVAPWGPDQATVSAVSCALFEHPAVQEFLMDARHRLLTFELVDPEQKVLTPKPPGRYRAT